MSIVKICMMRLRIELIAPLMNFTTQNVQWFSTPWSEMDYELIEHNSNRIFMASTPITHTHNIISKPSQQDLQTGSKE